MSYDQLCFLTLNLLSSFKAKCFLQLCQQCGLIYRVRDSGIFVVTYLALALSECELPREGGAGLPPFLVLLAVDLVQRRRERRLRLGERHPRLGQRSRVSSRSLLGRHRLLWETRPALSLHPGVVFESMLPLKLVLLAVGPVQENPFAVALLPAKVSEKVGVLKNCISLISYS